MMNERDIFLAAIDFADPAHRADFVAKACGTDAGLRAQVEALLQTHAQTSQFLETPAAAHDSLAQTLVTTPGETAKGAGAEQISGEAEFRQYLQPATRPGWLGRLAHYEIEAILGRGAFGIVAKAFDEKLHRVVAIKLMNPELASTSPPRQRFLREARTAAAVTQENIVAIYAVEEEPIPYLVMEYVPGQTLQQRMDAKGPFDAKEILRIGQQVAAGLAAAHAANLIHRDIKPANILLTGGLHERAKISDFGLARAVDDASMTSSGMIAGTPLYMAPEQARGETLDHRADLFSLGSVLYQMASGRPPFRAANTIAVLKRVCEDAPRPLDDVIPGVPGWLETIIFKLLEKDREDRYQSAGELAELLARCQRELETNGQVTCVKGKSHTAQTQVVSAARSTDQRPLRKPLGWLIGGILVVASVSVFALMNGRRQTPAPDTTSSPADVTSSASSAATSAAPPAVGWHGWPADAPKPAIAPFDAAQAKQHQEEWAVYLKVPVEYTNLIGMKFRLIPPGEFLMGSTPEQIAAALTHVDPNDQHRQGWIKSEAPQHTVILTQPIYLGVNEVNQADYKAVMGFNPSHYSANGQGKDAVAGLETTKHPVEMVSWNDAAEFCAKLSQQEKLTPFYFRADQTVTPLDGNGYRLPSEAEWEFACRAGTLTQYWIGDNDEDLVRAGWFAGNSGGRTHASGELKANPFGLSDVHGNVWEWVQDGWDPAFYGQTKAKPTIDPHSPFSTGSQRVVRGGVWSDGASYCRSSRRVDEDPMTRGRTLGFRVSLSIEAIRDVVNVSKAKSTRNTQQKVGSWHGRLAGAPKPAIAPFDAAQAKQHQKEWAAYLRVPVEYTNSIGMKFRLIPPGEYTCGSTQQAVEDLNRRFVGIPWKENWIAEVPAHRVRITKPFFLAVREVSFGEFRSFVEQTKQVTAAERDGGAVLYNAPKHPDHVWSNERFYPAGSASPVVLIALSEARAYCKWLSASTKRIAYRLPTEAEWEFACRAGDESTHPNQETESSQFGISGMLHWGRPAISEWCDDRMPEYPADLVTDPRGDQNPNSAAIRG